MISFEYKAITPDGKTITGILQGADESSVFKEIYKQGFRPVAVKKVKAVGTDSVEQFFKKKVKTDELVLFTRQLVTLIRAGVPILEALEALGQQSSKELAEIVKEIYVHVTTGKSFSEALRKHEKTFSSLYVNSVHAGEISGSLDDVLERMATVLKNDAETQKKVKSAMKYPVFVLIAMIAAFFVVMTMVVPKFAMIFTGLDVELPFATRLLMGISEFMQKYIFIILGVLGAGTLGFTLFTKRPRGRLWWDSLKMKMPVLGPLVQKSAITRFARMFETLNRSGLPILKTLDTVSKALGNARVQQSVQNMIIDVEGGKGISGSMKNDPVFPPMVVWMISVGEQSGSLDNMLKAIADHFETELKYTIEGLTSMIEPILTIVMGVAVVLMAFGIFLPMWNLVGAIN